MSDVDDFYARWLVARNKIDPRAFGVPLDSAEFIKQLEARRGAEAIQRANTQPASHRNDDRAGRHRPTPRSGLTVRVRLTVTRS